jgi:hypothetical protein
MVDLTEALACRRRAEAVERVAVVVAAVLAAVAAAAVLAVAAAGAVHRYDRRHRSRSRISAVAAADGSYVYAFTAQSIVRVDGDGQVQTIVDGIDTSIDGGLVVDDTYVYWTMGDRSNMRTVIWRAAKGGGTAQMVTAWPSDGVAMPLAEGPHALYVRVDSSIRRVSTPDGATTIIAVDGYPIAGDNVNLYSISYEPVPPGTCCGEAMVVRTALADGTTTVLAKWLGNRDFSGAVGPAVLAAGNVYVADEYELRVVSETAGGVIELRPPSGTEGEVTALASDGTHAYWISTHYDDSTGPGSRNYVDRWIVRDDAQVVASHLGAPNIDALVLMGDSAYFGSVERVCK